MESNFFAVKDPMAFSRFCERWDLDAVTNSEGLHGLREKSELWGVTDWSKYDEGGDLKDEVEEANSDASFIDELAEQLADRYVAVVQDLPNDHYPRGPSAEAFTVNNKHETVEISLITIFELASHLGWYVTEEMAF